MLEPLPVRWPGRLPLQRDGQRDQLRRDAPAEPVLDGGLPDRHDPDPEAPAGFSIADPGRQRRLIPRVNARPVRRASRAGAFDRETPSCENALLPIRRAPDVRLALAGRCLRGQAPGAVDGQPGRVLIHIDVTPVHAGIPERIRRVDFRPRPRDAIAKIGEQSMLARASRDEVERVHGPSLTDTVDAADALFESNRVPRQFQGDDHATRAVKVEPFAGGISGQENACSPAVEVVRSAAARS